MINLKTPNIDAVLLEEGYIRPNEAPLWIKKGDFGNREEHKFIYKIVFDIGQALISMENWFEKRPDKIEQTKKLVSECANNNICINYVVEKDLLAFILTLTADCYWHMHNNEAQEMEKKYIKDFEALTGLKWK